MRIERVSPITGKTRWMDLDITHEQLERWEKGELIQNAMPNLTPGEREFIMTGMSEQEFDDLFREV